MTSNSHGNQRGGGAFGPTGNRGNQRHDRGGQECYQCHKPGHVARDCPMSGSRDEVNRIFTPENDPLKYPDAKLKQEEDRRVKHLAPDSSSLGQLAIPSRPSYGTRGKPIVLRSNYFELKADPQSRLFRYEIQISPPGIKESRRQTRRLIQLLLEKDPPKPLSPADIATDFDSVLITSKPLPMSGDSLVVRRVYREADEPTPRPNAIEYTITIKQSKVLPLRQLVEFLASPKGVSPNGFDKKETIQALNCIMTRTAKERSDIYGGGKSEKFYRCLAGRDPMFDLGGGLVAVKGFYTSVRTSTSRLLVNINVANAAFYPAMELHALMRQHTPRVSDYLGSGLEYFITHLRVSHQFYGKKTVRTVKGFSYPCHDDEHDRPRLGNARQIRFRREENGIKGMTTVFTYFSDKYPGFPIQEPGLPCINIGSDKRPVFVPPELLTVEPGQPYTRKLDRFQTKAMIDIAVRRPAENARRIVGEGAQIMGLSETNPKLYRLGDSDSLIENSQGSWDLKNRQFSKAVQLPKWTFIKFDKMKIDHNVIREKLKNTAAKTGLGFPTPQPLDGYESPLQFPICPGTHRQNEDIIKKTMAWASGQDLKILFVILPSDNAFIYSQVKYYAEIYYGKLLQDCKRPSRSPSSNQAQRQDKTTSCLDRVGQLLKDRPEYAANIAHKFNLKLGGINQTIPSNRLGMLGDGKTMLVGMDVTHPSPGSLPNSPSIVGVVANTDSRFGQWPGSIRTQPKAEMITDLQEMFCERLDLWFRRNKNLPDRIIIYRDGVSESQYDALLKEELPKIEAACTSRYQAKTDGKYPRISMIVCGKRHHTRFYPTRTQDADTKQRQNCPNGTVVDRGVTMEHGWDFFLQAHHCIKGTAKPTHYVVMRDDNKFTADSLESFTHHLCYLSGRSTKAISLCPPAYFADLLCERGRMYLYKVYNSAQFDPRTAPVDAHGKFDKNHSSRPWSGGVHSALEESMFYI
ncbi:MAG: hypothetical protein Q9169_003817 [Polycauliona sp. 2 TL-2023]